MSQATTTTADRALLWSGESECGKKIHGSHHTLQGLASIEASSISQRNRKNFMRTAAETGLGRDKWYGTINSINHARKYVSEGWREGADRAMSLVSDVYAKCTIPEPKDVRRTQVWSDEGDELDYDKLMSGELDTMYRTTKKEGRATFPTATLLVNWGGLGSVKSGDLFWGGAVAIILTDILENAGYRIEIVGCNTSSFSPTDDEGERYIATSVAVKELDEPLRSDIVAGALCEAGVFRTLGFMGKNAADSKVTSGYGSTRCLKKVGVDVCESSPFSEDAFVVPHCRSMEDALEAIESVVKELDERCG